MFAKILMLGRKHIAYAWLVYVKRKHFAKAAKPLRGRSDGTVT